VIDSTMGRRTLLLLLGGSGLGLVVGCTDSSSDETGTICDAPDEVLAGVVVVGTRYRELAPDDDLDLGDDLGIDALRERVRADFEAGETVDVDGWVLALTEARAAALLADC
jgi:hypothetical protein